MNLRAFLDYITYEKRYSTHTVNAYRRDIQQFFDFVSSNQELDTIFPTDHKIARRWVADLISQNKKSATINRKITALKAFYKFLLQQKAVDSNPFDKINTLKAEKRLPEFVSSKQLNHALDLIENETQFEDVRNRLIIELLYATGMRRAELIALQEQDIDLQRMTIKVTGKRNKQRSIPINSQLCKLITEYNNCKPKTKSKFFFTTVKGKQLYPKFVYRVVHKFLSIATTLEKKSPHVLRHTFATHLLNNGADIYAIKQLLGHANLAATQVYTNNTFEKLKNIYKQAHPRANKKEE